MSDSAPLSFAQRASTLASTQAMPLQRAPKPASSAAAKKPAASPAVSVTSPTAAAPSNGQQLRSPTTATAAKSAPSPLNQAAAATPSPAASSAPSTGPSAGTGPVRVVKAAKQGFALVTAVSSGDTLIVIGTRTAAGQKTPEKIIIVSGIQAPKFAKGKNQKDEPFAWESREYLRKRVIGKQSQHTLNTCGSGTLSRIPHSP